MSKLFAADMYKIIKSKLTLVLLIIAVGLPVLLVLTSFFMKLFAASLVSDPTEEALINSMFDAKTLMASSFSMTNNLGLIIPIFSAIIVGADLSNGTLRNKIIAGHKRWQIYLSHLLTMIIYDVVAILIGFGITALLSIAFFGYGVEFTSAEALNLVYFIITGVMAFAFLASLSTLLSLVMKSTPLAIVLVVAITFAITLIASVLPLLEFFDIEKIKYLMYAVPSYVNTQFASDKIDTVMFIISMISYLFFIAINTVFGILLFNKKELK